MIFIILNKISDYWNISKLILDYWVITYISRERFKELHMRMQLAEKDAQGPYAKVSRKPRFILIYLLILAYLGRTT
jgi:hypothetical protein